MSSSITKPLLYSFWRSSCSYRVRIALSLKGIEYDVKSINLLKREGEKSDFRKINPTGYIPTLKIDDHTLFESMAILHYLEETRPDPPLLPSNPDKRAKVRAICEIINAGIQPLQNIGVVNNFVQEKQEEWAQKWINRGFESLETILQDTAGKYTFGDHITMADCFLVPQVYNARRFQVDLCPYPHILEIDRTLGSHPAFRAAHPSTQPEHPPQK